MAIKSVSGFEYRYLVLFIEITFFLFFLAIECRRSSFEKVNFVPKVVFTSKRLVCPCADATAKIKLIFLKTR